MSPKKLKKKLKFKNICQLAKRKKKNYFTKRVGTVVKGRQTADDLDKKIAQTEDINNVDTSSKAMLLSELEQEK